MKTVIVLSVLVAVAIAASLPIEHGSSSWQGNKPVHFIRTKKSSNLPDQAVFSEVAILPEEDLPSSRTFHKKLGLKKPPIFHPMHGHGYPYHHFRETEEDIAKEAMDQSEEAMRNVEVEKKSPWVSSDNHSDMKKNIRIAKEAVDNIQTSFEKIENSPSMKTSNWEKTESDQDLHHSIKTAKEALEHVRRSFHDLENFDDKDMESSATNLAAVLSAKDNEERMAQWKDTIENIQKNNGQQSSINPKTDVEQNLQKRNIVSDQTKGDIKIESQPNVNTEKEAHEISKSLDHNGEGLEEQATSQNTKVPITQIGQLNNVKHIERHNDDNINAKISGKTSETENQDNFESTSNSVNLQQNNEAKMVQTEDVDHTKNVLPKKSFNVDNENSEMSVKMVKSDEMKEAKIEEENNNSESDKVKNAQISDQSAKDEKDLSVTAQKQNDKKVDIDNTMSQTQTPKMSDNNMDQMIMKSADNSMQHTFVPQSKNENDFPVPRIQAEIPQRAKTVQEDNIMQQSSAIKSVDARKDLGDDQHAAKMHTHPHATARGAYGIGAGMSGPGSYGIAGGAGSSWAGGAHGAAGGPALGLFPNTNIGGCAIPLLLSCSPSVVSGTIAKPHSAGYTLPAYRASEDFRMNNNRDIKTARNVPNGKERMTLTPQKAVDFDMKH